MGGGHHEKLDVPHYSVYNNYRKFPELAAHEDKLKRLGLRDPWIRCVKTCKVPLRNLQDPTVRPS